MSPHDWLLAASRNALKVLNAQIKGEYYGPNEDIHVARELSAAIALVEQEQQQRELVDRR